MNTISKLMMVAALVLSASGPLSGCADSMKKNSNGQGVTGISDALTGNDGSLAENDPAGEVRQITVGIDDSGLTKTTVMVGDGEFDYYKYDNAAVGTVKVTLSGLPASVEELKQLQLPSVEPVFY